MWDLAEVIPTEVKTLLFSPDRNMVILGLVFSFDAEVALCFP